MAATARLLRPSLRLARLSSPAIPHPSPTLLLRAACRQHPSTTPTSTYTPLRQQHTIPRPRPPPPPTTTTTTQPDQPSSPPQPRDEYELTFTCTPCTRRSTHRISKHGYHRGSVLVTCPGCRNRHVISDHLGIFGSSDRPGGWTIEDLLRERGEGVKRGRLQPAAESGETGGSEEDLEFWDDGTVTTRDRDEVERRLRWERKDEGEEGAAPGASFKSVRAGEKKEGE